MSIKSEECKKCSNYACLCRNCRGLLDACYIGTPCSFDEDTLCPWTKVETDVFENKI